VSPAPVAGLRAVTFDFGNTLVPVDRAGLQAVVEETASAAVGRLGPFTLDAFLAIWAEERDRQFREEVPQFREVDLAIRFQRVLARLRGMDPPAPDDAWDDELAARSSEADEIAWAVEVYSDSFVRGLPPRPSVGPILRRLAERFDLGLVSNWPLAATIDRYIAAAGWAPLFRAVVISQRFGTIKPHPSIFAEARRGLGDPEPRAILHVGDDWAADVVGAATAGWRVAYLNARPADSPLPSSERDGKVVPDLEITTIDELPDLLGLAAPDTAPPTDR
jgi:FMN phosphatase YigB (HAD superfamily)